MQINSRLKAADWQEHRCGGALNIIGGGLLLLCLAVDGTVSAQALEWVPRGPGPNTGGQVENIANREVVGAIHAVAPHPTNADVVYVGAVNGGVWMTSNAMAASPTWVRMTDAEESLSIGALEFDPTDATNQTLVAGIGGFSSFGVSGARTGLLRTTDGATWMSIDGGGALDGLNISGVAPRGNTFVVAATNGGIFRSTDLGANFTQISGGPGTGLPAGASFDLTSDPTNASRLFTNAGGNGVYRSTDSGATWTKVSDAAMDALISVAGNIEIAVGTSNNVYVAIVTGGQLAGVFRSPDGGATWAAMDLPTTVEGGIHPGGQGNIHLSIAADPNNANIVYIGGDRQASPFPSSIGANDFSGRLFRGDASQPAGSQFVHLTHSNSMGAAGGGTTGGSAPHADSRDMDIAANGVLIEVDDGGIYRRTNPQTNNGDWFSMNGDIQTTEFHAVAWDADANIVIGGAQDTGTPQQPTPSTVQWQSVSTADGGVVAVDDSSTPGFSTRYSSFQFLGAFRRRVYMGNVFQSQAFPALTPVSGAALNAQFYTPIEVNAVTPTRLILGAANGVYESLDQGDTVTAIAPTVRANAGGRDPIAYGSAGNADILYVGAGSQVFIRQAAHPAPLAASATYPGGFVAGIAIDPGDPQTAYVVDTGSVYQTADAGATWANITGDLPTLATGTLRSIAYSARTADGLVVVGGDRGVFWAPGPDFSDWSRLGAGLSTVPVFELEYDAADEIILAGTLGRGAWTLDLGELPDLAIAKTDNPDPVPAGGVLAYTLTVTNNGPGVASDVQVTDTLPTGVTHISDNGNCTPGTGTVTCPIPELMATDSVAIEIVVEVDGLLVDNTGSATIVDEASAGGPTPDLDLSDNTDSENTSVLPGCGGMFATIVGTPADDHFLDTAADDVIAALAGDDAVGAHLGGDDAICGGGGNDHVVDSAGDNEIDTGPGDDAVGAGSGDDAIDTGSGNDSIRAQSGDDTIDAGPGDDHVNTGSGNDGIAAGSGNDNIAAGRGNDAVEAGPGDDNVNAGPGDDDVNAGPGDDLINGGAGTDTCVGGEVVSQCE